MIDFLLEYRLMGDAIFTVFALPAFWVICRRMAVNPLYALLVIIPQLGLFLLLLRLAAGTSRLPAPFAKTPGEPGDITPKGRS